MKYMRIETALNHLAGNSQQDGRFHGTAGAFESILKDEDATPDEKAEKIAEIIERGIKPK